jgi:hypothetical protein
MQVTGTSGGIGGRNASLNNIGSGPGAQHIQMILIDG